MDEFYSLFYYIIYEDIYYKRYCYDFNGFWRNNNLYNLNQVLRRKKNNRRKKYDELAKKIKFK